MIVGELIKISSTATQQLFMTTSLPAARSPPDVQNHRRPFADFDAFWRSKGKGARASLLPSGGRHVRRRVTARKGAFAPQPSAPIFPSRAWR